MITPRITRLLRVPDLQAMHAAIASAALDDGSGDAVRVRACAVVVPSRGAAEALRRTLENLRFATGAGAVMLPDIRTRTELYERLHAALPDAPPRLTEFEREVIFRRGAVEAAEQGAPPPFDLRPGLIVEILAFYDELRRRDRTIEAFERLMVGALEPSAEIDRGAERLLRLTRFLAAAFTRFEAAVAGSGGIDEHALRRLLLAPPPAPPEPPYRHIVVTVPDQAADPNGLWLADFDLLARLPGLERLDLVATENILAAGFHERVHDLFPGIEEARAGVEARPPRLAVRKAADGAMTRWTVWRDREEELADVARSLKNDPPRSLERSAVVFQRPLPYLYLARQVFPDAAVPYQALDALPLAAEPFAAALDLVLSFVAGEGTRGALVDLLRSPHWTFAGPAAIAPHEVAALDALLLDVKYLGGWSALAALAGTAARRASEPAQSAWTRAAPALAAAQAAAQALRPVAEAPAASAQIDALLAFVAAHERLPGAAEPWTGRHFRARGAIAGALTSLAEAHRRHDDRPIPFAELAGTIRRWIEGQTFAPRTGSDGVVLLDAPAAAYADADEVRLVGLVESDWPDRSRRSIFYPASLLAQLGWPTEGERTAAARARFQDLLRLARERVAVSLFTLEDDAIVPASSFLEEVQGDLPVEERPDAPPGRVFFHEALAIEPVTAAALDGEPREWLAVRASRSGGGGAAFHGETGSRAAAAYAVSRLERYLECPFKYFAAHVLRLPEERTEEAGLTPQERGQLVHDVFEAFFSRWQARGNGAITTATFAEALAEFERVAEERIAALPEADRAIERTHLLGSAAAPGLAERAFVFEIEQGGEVIERLLEHELAGTFAFETGEGVRNVELRAKADRIDLMADGTLRLIDYKLGKAPKASRALQLPVYGVCAQQALAGRHGRSWTLGQAGYVAFREKNAFVSLGGSTSLAEAVTAGQARLLNAVDAIERGEFPPNPDEPFLCTRCGYASVCRKDYVGDE